MDYRKSKLQEIEKIIRYHYFNDLCPHTKYENCCAVIVSEIMAVTGYQPRFTLQENGKK